MGTDVTRSPAIKLFEEALHRDRAAQERLVAMLLFGANFSVVIAYHLFSWLEIMPRTNVIYTAYIGAAWGAFAWLVLRRWYAPWFSVMAVLVECTFVPSAIWNDMLILGPLNALHTPATTMAPILVMLCGLRGSRSLSVLSTVLSTSALLFVHLSIWEQLRGADRYFAPLADIPLRAMVVIIAGALSVLIAHTFEKRARSAMRAVRERDFLGKYLLHERVGAGGMAEVFRATYSPEGGFEKAVAIKRVLPAYADDKHFLDLFRAEAKLGSQLHHPNVVQVLDFGTLDGSWFLAMELVDGASLGRVLRDGPLSPRAVAWIGAELGSALAYVHSRADENGAPLGLVHRDINPPNVLVSSTGDVKLSDFGIAKALSSVPTTDVGSVRGKVRYMSPEQLRGDALDGRADLFAVGLTMFEALTGSSALASTDSEAIATLMKGEITRVKDLRPDVADELASIIDALLVANRDDRIATGDELRQRCLAFDRGSAALDGRTDLAARVRAADHEGPANVATPSITRKASGDMPTRRAKVT